MNRKKDCATCDGTGIVGPRMIAEEPCCNCGGSGKIFVEALNENRILTPRRPLA